MNLAGHTRFEFQIVTGMDVRDSSPQEWLRQWAARYKEYDEKEYRDLIANHKSFSAQHFERIGKWKDNAKTAARWKPNVASVAYLIWIEAARELPKCPKDCDVATFLNEWSSRTYVDIFTNKSVEKRFGLSRATTLLHFVSGGRWPIYDQRVRTAISRLCKSSLPANTIDQYVTSFCPLFLEFAAICDTRNDLRKLDKALFSYGAFDGFPSSD